MLATNRDEIGVNHFVHQGIKSCLVPPAEFHLGLAGVAEQRVDFSRPVVAPIDLDQNSSVRSIDSLLVLAVASPSPLAPPVTIAAVPFSSMAGA